MNSDKFRSQWRELRGDLKAHWSRLTERDMDQIAGNYDRFLGRVQQLYQVTRESVHGRVKRVSEAAAEAHGAASGPPR